MSAAMEEARKLLYEKAIKKFTMQEITKHRTAKSKNLVEMLSRYPGYGVGFKVQRKWWPAGTFMHVKRVHLFSPRYGQMWGVMYKDNQIAGNKVEKITEALKRDEWSYELSDASFTEHQVTLDNGLTMDLLRTQQLFNEKKEFLSQRKKQMQWIGEPDLEDEPWSKPKKEVPVKGKGKAPPKKK
jgi:hypothetical protein